MNAATVVVTFGLVSDLILKISYVQGLNTFTCS